MGAADARRIDLTREDLICHILRMKALDADYARHALRWYAELLPWMELVAGVREAMNESSSGV